MPSSLLTPEVTSITAFTIALLSMFGVGSAMLVAQSVLGAPAGPDPSALRAWNLMAAALLLGMALGAILLACGVFRQAGPWCAEWARHLAGAAAPSRP